MAILLLEAIIGQPYKQTRSTTKNNTPEQTTSTTKNKRKALKESTKGGLTATVTRAQETRKTELKRRFYRLNGASGI